MVAIVTDMVTMVGEFYANFTKARGKKIRLKEEKMSWAGIWEMGSLDLTVTGYPRCGPLGSLWGPR